MPSPENINPLRGEIWDTAESVLSEHAGEALTASSIVEISGLVSYQARIELVGTKEVAQILHVSKQRIGQLEEKRQTPEEVARLAATPVWLRKDIEELFVIRQARGHLPRRPE